MSCFFLLKYFSMMEHNRLIKVTLFSFPQNIPFSTIVHFGPNLSQTYATLCPRELCHMVHSLKVLKYNTLGQHSYTKVILVNLPKNSLSGQGQLMPNFGQNYTTCLMIHSLRIFLRFCGMMRHNKQTNVVFVVFPKKSPFGAIWSPS